MVVSTNNKSVCCRCEQAYYNTMSDHIALQQGSQQSSVSRTNVEWPGMLYSQTVVERIAQSERSSSQ